MNKKGYGINIIVLLGLIAISLYLTIYFLDKTSTNAFDAVSTCKSELHQCSEQAKEDIKAFNTELANKKEEELYALRDYISVRNSKIPSEVVIIIAEAIQAGCEKHEIDFNLAVGLADLESTFNPSATSSAGARGLYQIMPSVWAEELDIEDTNNLYDIGYNVDKGLSILRHYIDKNGGDINEALKNYNGTKEQKFPNMVYARVGRFVVFKNN